MALEPISAEGCGRVLREVLEDTSPRRDSAESLIGNVLARGIVTSEQVEECRRVHAESLRAGTAVRLEHILLRKGYLPIERYLELLDAPPKGDVRLAPGSRLGRYRLERVIGRGGMGIVYLAEDPELRRTLALKTLHLDDGDTAVVSRFHREAAIGAQLHHPNVVQVYEVGTLDAGPGDRVRFIAMEYVEGRTFADVLTDTGSSRAERLRIVEEVARAVGYAHSRGVVHRDVKPSNVMVERSGRVVLMDFGLARAEAFASKLTRSDAVIGTPQYMSPEQVVGKAGRIDARSDVYALGAMLYEALTGTAPFRSESATRLYQQILNEDPIRPTALDSTIEPDLEVICLKALSKEKERRYEDGAAFADDLARFARGEPIRARPASWWYRVRKRLRKRRRTLTLTGLAAVLTAAVVLPAMHFLGRDRDSRQSRAEGDRAFAGGDWSKALAEYERALRLRSDESLRERIETCRNRIASDRAATERKLDDARRYRRMQEEKIVPLMAKLRNARLYSYIAAVDLRPRIEEVERALDELPKCTEDPFLARQGELWVLLGEGLEFVGDIDGAERALRRAESLRPEDGRIARLLGRIYTEKSLENLFHAESRCAEAHPATREWGERAVRYLERGCREGVGDREIDLLVGMVCIALARGDRSEAQRLSRIGFNRLPKEVGREEFLYLEAAIDGEESLRLLREALEIRPHFPRAYLLRAIRRLQAGDEAAALADLDRAIRLNPRLSRARLHRGLVRAKRREWAAALEDLNETIRLTPDFAHPRAHRGVVHSEMGEFDRALKDFDAAIGANSKDSLAYLGRGEARRMKRDYVGALDDFTRAIDLGTVADAAYRQRGLVHLPRKRPVEGIFDLDEAIRLSPQDARAFHLRALAHEMAGRPTEARRDFDESIRLRSGAVGAVLDRGHFRYRGGDWDGAVQDYSRVIELEPKNAEAFFWRGQVRVSQQKYDLAMEDYSTAIRYNSKHADARCRRAYLKSLRGDTAGAVEDYREALKAAPPEWAYREEIRKWLEDHD